MQQEFVFLSLISLALARSYAGGKDRIVTANARIRPNAVGTFNEVVLGEVYIAQEVKNGYAQQASFRVKLSGFKPYSIHGFHVHVYGDIFSNGCNSAGGHYNPFNLTHGGSNDVIRHGGDFGNLHANQNGEVDVTFKDRLASLVGKNVIQGRSFVVHEGRDDLGRGTGTARAGSLSTGNAGARLACGIIYMTDNDHVLPHINLSTFQQKEHLNNFHYHHRFRHQHSHGRNNPYHHKRVHLW